MKSTWAVDIGQEFKPPFQDIGSFISVLLPNVYVIASVLLFFLLIFGGFGFIVSAGNQNPEGTQKAGGAVRAALMGFILIFASYWIIQIIEIITGVDILK